MCQKSCPSKIIGSICSCNRYEIHCPKSTSYQINFIPQLKSLYENLKSFHSLFGHAWPHSCKITSSIFSFNFIPPIVFGILKFKNPAIWLTKSIIALNLRTRFFPDMRFWQILKAMHDLNPENPHINGLFFYFLQNQKNLILGVFLGIVPKWDFSQNLALSVFLPLRHRNFMRSFRKILWAVLEKIGLPTDILTYWQWWNHRTNFRLKAGVQ